MRHKRTGFTLVEILVVLGIITLLAGLLFPVFNRARERGRQTNCASNLVQIHQAVRLYYDDAKRYPASIRDLLPSDAVIPVDVTAGTTVVAADSTGYLKGGRDSLVCPSDDTEADLLRSSYGNLALVFVSPVDGGGTADPLLKSGLFTSGEPNLDVDPGRWVYNAFGYDENGWAYTNEAEALAAHQPGGADCGPGNLCPDLVKPDAPYNPKTNPVKASLSNRLAPPETIITHCVYHRTWTSNADYPGELSIPSTATNASGARDIVLRLNGTAKLVDVSSFKTGQNAWQRPAF